MYDTFSESFTNSGTSLTWSHTCSGTNRILWVGVMTLNTRSISGITYNGVAMTPLTRSGGPQPIQLWYLINPALGANNIIATLSGDASFLYGAGTSYFNAVQSGVPDSQNTATSIGTPLSTSTTIVNPNCWLVMAVRNDGDGLSDASTGAVERATGSAGTIQIYDSNGIVGTGSQSMSITLAGGGTTDRAIASFQMITASNSGFFSFF